MFGQGYILCKILWWGGGRIMVAGKKIKNEGLWEKNEKGETKREENYIKKRGKRL